jgi:hypothetical protein
MNWQILKTKTFWGAIAVPVWAVIAAQFGLSDQVTEIGYAAIAAFTGVAMRQAIGRKADPALKMLAFLVLALAAGGCSLYRVSHIEKATDGTLMRTSLIEMVPPGGKKLSEGAADIGVDAEGTWHLKLNADSETDATGTAQLMEAMGQAAMRAYLQSLVPAPIPPSGSPNGG